MTWFAVYEAATGRLRSVGTVITDPLAPGLAKLDLGLVRPPDSEMWDEATLSYVPRPAKVLVDRFDVDLLTHNRYKGFVEVYNSLSSPDKAKIRNAIRDLLGPRTHRDSDEPLSLENIP